MFNMTTIDNNILVPIVSAIGSVIATLFITHLLNKGKSSRELNILNTQLEDKRSECKKLKSEIIKCSSDLKECKTTIDSLNKIKLKFENMNSILSKSSVVRSLLQPVIIMGPRGVGKTSLVLQLHAPWIHEKLKGSIDHTHSEVPIFDFVEKDLTNHFANPELKVRLNTHLLLDMHDFPGDIAAQTQIKEIILEQAKEIKHRTSKNLGLILICMFNSEEAETSISQATKDYYNGDLFNQIRSFVIDNQVSIDRLILVFNHFDKLLKLKPQSSTHSLSKDCLEKFKPIYSDLNRICNKEKVCEVFTVLGGDDILLENRGANMVKGECSRKFVSFFVDEIKVKEIIPETATNNSSKYWT